MSVGIDIENVIKKYGNDTVISGLSVQIKPGEFFTLLGPSGCGKTTLLRMIIGFNSIEGGTIKVGDRIINAISPDKRNMGMVFQNYAIFPHMSVKENVAFGLRMRKLPEADIARQVQDILRIVKIDHLQDRMPVELSGGQQQRVALARAIVIHPEVLLMDEPLSNLDAKLRVEMRNAIKHIQRQVNITTVYVTHDQEEALAISDRIAVMNNGVIQQIDSPQQIYQRPANVFVSSFIGLSNLLPAAVITGLAAAPGIAFEGGYHVAIPALCRDVTEGQPVLVAVRPEEFQIAKQGDGLAATIKASVFLGLHTHYFVELDGGQELEVIQNQDDGPILAEGTRIRLTVKADKINVFHATTQNTLIQGDAS